MKAKQSYKIGDLVRLDIELLRELHCDDEGRDSISETKHTAIKERYRMDFFAIYKIEDIGISSAGLVNVETGKEAGLWVNFKWLIPVHKPIFSFDESLFNIE